MFYTNNEHAPCSYSKSLRTVNPMHVKHKYSKNSLSLAALVNSSLFDRGIKITKGSLFVKQPNLLFLSLHFLNYYIPGNVSHYIICNARKPQWTERCCKTATRPFSAILHFNYSGPFSFEYTCVCF